MMAAPPAIRQAAIPVFQVSRSPRKAAASSTHEHHAQLVDGRHPRGGTRLQRAIVAKPRQAGCDARQHQEQDTVHGQLGRALPFVARPDDRRRDQQYDDGAKKCRKVGIDLGHCDLAEDRGQRGKKGGSYRVRAPVRAHVRSSAAAPVCRAQMPHRGARLQRARSRSAPAPAFSSTCATVEAFGITKVFGCRSRNASAIWRAVA